MKFEEKEPERDLREIRDIIDDILVRFEMLEKELHSFSKEVRFKGRIMRIRDWIDDIHDLLIELKKTSEKIDSSQR